jgi:hypothetical protein
MLDNENDLDSQIQEIFDNEDSAVEENPDEQVEDSETKETETKEEIDCPSEFLKEDGSVDVSNLLKSYNEIVPLVAQKSDWEKEKAELEKQVNFARNLQNQQLEQVQSEGYQDTDDMRLVREVAKAQAREYEKYLYTVAEPERIQGMLALYAQNPNPELLARIEEEFGVDVVKRATIFAERYKTQVQEKLNLEKYEQYRQEAQNFVSKSINDYPDWFKIPEFVDFFKDALTVKGDAFETSQLVQHLQKLKDYFHKEFEEEQKLNSENEKDKNILKKLSPNNNSQNLVNKKYEDYTPEELDKAIEALI